MKDNIFPYSTEWSFHAATGFSIESWGEVRGGRGAVRSYRFAAAELRLAGIHRDSTQADFVNGRTVPEYASAATGVFRASGTDLDLYGKGTGPALATYPEPMLALSPGQAAEYDGYVGLATLEEEPDGSQTFLHHFDEGWRADFARGESEAGPESGLDRPPTMLWEAEFPGTLYPDGVGMESDSGKTEPGVYGSPARPLFDSPWQRNLAWPVRENIPEGGNHGLVAFWRKNLFLHSSGNGSDGMHNWTQAIPTSEFSLIGQNQGLTRVFILGSLNSVEQGVVAETRFDSVYDQDESGTPTERIAYVRRGAYNPLSATQRADDRLLRWNLVACVWDLGRDIRYWETDISERDIGWKAGTKSASGTRNDWASPSSDWNDFSFYLGDRSHRYQRQGPGQEARNFGQSSGYLMDEFTVYDLPYPDASSDEQWSENVNWATETVLRWRQTGRYYKENDAVYRSPSVSLGGGKIRRLYWTQFEDIHLPNQPPGMYLSVRFSGATAGTGELFNDAGEKLDMDTWGPVRYQVRFYPTPHLSPDDPERLSTPVMESPVLDDITIYYELPEGEEVLLYEER